MHTDQWNIIEGHGRMVTKGYEVSKECFLRRRVFDIEVNGERQHAKKRKKFTTLCIDKHMGRTELKR